MKRPALTFEMLQAVPCAPERLSQLVEPSSSLLGVALAFALTLHCPHVCFVRCQLTVTTCRTRLDCARASCSHPLSLVGCISHVPPAEVGRATRCSRGRR
eukprot:12254868-Alexandrium_andersonii.AAC.1